MLTAVEVGEAVAAKEAMAVAGALVVALRNQRLWRSASAAVIGGVRASASTTSAHTYRASSTGRGQGGAYRRSPSEDASSTDAATATCPTYDGPYRAK